MIDLDQSDSFAFKRRLKTKREILANISWETEVFNIYNPIHSDCSLESVGFEDDTLGQLPI